MTEVNENNDFSGFNYATQVDLHVLDSKPNIPSIVAIGIEHGFRGVLVHPARIEALAQEIKKYAGSSEIMPIALLDFPYGSSTVAARNYAITDAKEKGAKEVEIVAPYHFLAEKDFKMFENDMQATRMHAIKTCIKIKYVVDFNSDFINEDVLTRISRIANSCNMFISTSTGFFDKKINHSDNILKIRTVKNKANIKIKSYINDDNLDTLLAYNKSGVDVIGMDIAKAPFIVHAFEEQIK